MIDQEELYRLMGFTEADDDFTVDADGDDDSSDEDSGSNDTSEDSGDDSSDTDDSGDNSDEESGNDDTSESDDKGDDTGDQENDDNFDIDDSDGDSDEDSDSEDGDDNSDSNDDSSDDSDGDGEDDTSDEANETKAEYDKIYDELTPEEKANRDMVLKKEFKNLHKICRDIIGQTTYFPNTASSQPLIKRTVESLHKFSEYLAFYLQNVYEKKAYIENRIELEKCQQILNGIKSIYQQFEKMFNTMNKDK